MPRNGDVREGRSDGTSRGAPSPPPTARVVFGRQLDAAVAYADLLATEGVLRGLIGPREVGRLWERHLLNCAVVQALIPPGASLIDVGSGAGLPGIVLALARSDLSVVLVEPLERRAAFLRDCVRSLGLPVEVRWARAEELAGSVHAEVVAARAVAPLDRLLPLALPLVSRGGRVMAIKGERAEAELAAARPVLRRLGVSAAHVHVVGTGVVHPPTRVVVVDPGSSDGRLGGSRRKVRPPAVRRGRR